MTSKILVHINRSCIGDNGPYFGSLHLITDIVTKDERRRNYAPSWEVRTILGIASEKSDFQHIRIPEWNMINTVPKTPNMRGWERGRARPTARSGFDRRTLPRLPLHDSLKIGHEAWYRQGVSGRKENKLKQNSRKALDYLFQLLLMSPEVLKKWKGQPSQPVDKT